MKNIFFGFIAIATVSLCIISCGNKAKKQAETETTQVVDKTGKEYTSAYICPMHCKGSGSDKGGECPVCKMDYVLNKEHKGAHDHSGHNHDHHDHSGHDHSNHDGHDHSDHGGHDHGNHDGHNH